MTRTGLALSSMYVGGVWVVLLSICVRHSPTLVAQNSERGTKRQRHAPACYFLDDGALVSPESQRFPARPIGNQCMFNDGLGCPFGFPVWYEGVRCSGQTVTSHAICCLARVLGSCLIMSPDIRGPLTAPSLHSTSKSFHRTLRQVDLGIWALGRMSGVMCVTNGGSCHLYCLNM